MRFRVFHPDVHIFVAKDVGSDYSIKQAFGKVKKGDKVDFVVFAQVENLQTKINSFQISIEAPSGIDAVAPHVETMSSAKDSFWFPWPFSVRFDEAGSYKVKFSVKLDDSSNYTVVSEKTIVSE
ncbi:MAG: copper amine oxidase [Paenibacillaceae bacterium]|nr:copper amine oxidase [Paenibacillaceae bacterium]